MLTFDQRNQICASQHEIDLSITKYGYPNSFVAWYADSVAGIRRCCGQIRDSDRRNLFSGRVLLLSVVRKIESPFW